MVKGWSWWWVGRGAVGGSPETEKLGLSVWAARSPKGWQREGGTTLHLRSLLLKLE